MNPPLLGNKSAIGASHCLASVLDIGLSELLNTKYVKDAISELDSSMDGDESNIPLSDAHGDSCSTNAISIIGLGSKHAEPSSHNVLRGAPIHPRKEVFES